MPARTSVSRSSPVAASLAASTAAFVAAFAVAAVALVAPGAAQAQKTAPYDGYLCCSMLTDGSWISDLGYDDAYKKVVPAGTPVKFTGFGRWRMLLEIDGKKVGLGNDYSRTMDMDEFAKLYVLTQDPRPRLQSYAPKVRDAILARKLVKGMTREQVVMALGYPSTSYTPDRSKTLWHYRHSIGDYQVFWSNEGRLDLVFGPPEVRSKMLIE
jgi:hypothetical protein